MSRIGQLADVERGIGSIVDTMLFYMQKMRQGNYFSAEDREKALAEIEAALPILKRLLWKAKNIEHPL